MPRILNYNFLIALALASILAFYIFYTDLFSSGLLFGHDWSTPVTGRNNTKGSKSNVEIPGSISPKLYSPIISLLKEAAYLRVYSTEILFESQDISQAVSLSEELSPSSTSGIFLSYKNSLQFTGETTNYFLYHLDRCLDFFVDDSQIFTWTGRLDDRDDLHDFYYDALNSCQIAKANHQLVLSEIDRLTTELSHVHTIVIDSFEALISAHEDTFAYRIFHFPITADRFASRQKMYTFWTGYYTKAIAKSAEARQRMMNVDVPLETVTGILKAANHGQVTNAKYFWAALESKELFKMLAFNYALTGRKYKTDKTAPPRYIDLL